MEYKLIKDCALWRAYSVETKIIHFSSLSKKRAELWIAANTTIR